LAELTDEMNKILKKIDNSTEFIFHNTLLRRVLTAKKALKLKKHRLALRILCYLAVEKEIASDLVWNYNIIKSLPSESERHGSLKTESGVCLFFNVNNYIVSTEAIGELNAILTRHEKIIKAFKHKELVWNTRIQAQLTLIPKYENQLGSVLQNGLHYAISVITDWLLTEFSIDHKLQVLVHSGEMVLGNLGILMV